MTWNAVLLCVYVDLVLPFLCLYLFPYYRMRAEKILSDTFDSSMAEKTLILVFLISGISYALLVDLVLKYRNRQKDIWILAVGILILIIWNQAGGAGYLNYWPFMAYNRPFCALYTGCNLYLAIRILSKKK